MDCLRTVISRKLPCTWKFSELRPPLCTPAETMEPGKKSSRLHLNMGSGAGDTRSGRGLELLSTPPQCLAL